ncbi:hypothetical protein MidiMira_14 [Proteus phage MidiMira-UFV02]|nr:hypothetical protein BigMira_14 [Proteus phage BigMira-UFV01]WJJ57741.1 hypothetical protein MidiMira_14 [Proteus phage MidiMira-UFV02]
MLTLIVFILLFFASTVVIDRMFGLNKADISEVFNYYIFAGVLTLATKGSYYLAQLIVG